MSFDNGPRIVTNGLVLALDAADRNSYVSGSTTWFDLSGNNNSGSLVNGPTFNLANGGSIVFDGVDDYIAESNFSSFISDSFTINTWVNFTNANSPQYQKIFHAQSGSSIYSEVNLDNYNGGSGNAKYHFYTHALSNTSTNDIMTSSMFIVNNIWTNMVGVYDNSSKIKYLYINGIVNVSGSTTVQISWPNSVSRIALRLNNTEPLNGRVSSMQIYNRALSAAEIQQNYNAQKSRFGLT